MIYFNPTNIFQYANQLLQLENGVLITYSGALPWRVYEKAPSGHPRFVGKTLYETGDCLDICCWLNAHHAMLAADVLSQRE